ncbi:Na/Pi cotransporter family protein [Limibacillus sp. MBR-115]|jgi:phosphate:Na+ symporter|uniref:Na/Pi cotransporter family protein n=1 Tax=Limibacillus sp. MBR-115 TaxID=3156465 RepID=UPI003392C88A
MDLSGTEVIINLVGGVALLLWGVRMVRTGITRAFGAWLRRVVAAGTSSRLRAFFFGILVTGLLQSSTATALVVAGFASRAMMTTAAALAIMLGADVGSTLVAQVFSFDLKSLSPLLIVAGVTAFLSSERALIRQLGRAGVGLGLMLLSLKLIVGSSAALRGSEILPLLMERLGDEPLIAFLVAAVLTWLAHSSLAMVLLFMSLATAGIIEPLLGLALVLGANVGGAIAPVAMTAGSGALARRPPVGNLMMRFIGAALLLGFLPECLALLERLEGDSPRLIVNAHTGFNLAVALVFLPLTGIVAKLLERLLPDVEQEEDDSRPRYLDPDAVDTPSVALASAARETLRLGDMVEQMLRQSMEVFCKDDQKLLREISTRDDDVDKLYEAIKIYLTRLSREEMDREESQRHTAILTFTTNLEHIGDIIDKNLMELAAKKIKNRLLFSSSGLKEIEKLHAVVMDNLGLALNVFVSEDAGLARQLLDQKVTIRALEQKLAELHFERVSAGRQESIETSALHLDVIRDLKRINGHLTSVAYPILESRGELAQSRLRKRDAASGSDKPAKKRQNLPEEASNLEASGNCRPAKT